MSRSAWRRPLLWALVAYMSALAALRAKGFFVPAAAAPISRDALIDSPLREDRFGWKAEARAGEARLLLRWPAGVDSGTLPLPGQTARLEGRLRRPRPARNPGDFDEAAFLADKGISWVLEVERTTAASQPVAWNRLPWFWAESLHRRVRARLRFLLPLERARLAEGFMLGYKGALNPALNRAVQDAGLIHLIVPSGAKVMLAAAAAVGLAALLRLGPWTKAAAAAAAALAVTLAAGGEPPYWRAALAVAALAVSRALGRESDAFQALLVSAWLQLLVWPRALFSAGFQMTYLAMLGLGVLGPAVGNAARSARSRWKSVIIRSVGTAVVVQASLWPIFAQIFGRGSLMGLLANAAAMPAFPLLAGGGWLLCVAPAAAPVYSAVVAGFERLCFVAAAAPAAALSLSPWPWYSTAAYYLALLGLGRGRSRWAAAMLGAALALRVGGAAAARVRAPALRIVYLKVPGLRSGPRRAALVTFDGRLTWLVGAAPRSLLAKACRAYGIERVDGEIPSTPRLRLCRGEACFAFQPPGVVSPQSAIIAAPAEVSTDGFEIHVRR